MHKHGDLKQKLTVVRTALTILLICTHLQIYSKTAEAGASSAAKVLVTLNVPNGNGNASVVNLTNSNSNQFQNEYQFNRQSPSKATVSERHKSTAPQISDATTTTASISFDSSTNDSNVSDYPYTDGRIMTNVPECRGRLRLNGTRGYITDGPGYYQTHLQCIWLIDSGLSSATIRLQIHQFNTECNYDYLYVFDGDSVYSPLVAALSGDIKDFSNALKDPRFEDSISSSEDNNSEYLTSITPTNSISNISNSSTSTSIDIAEPKNTQSSVSKQESQRTVELKTLSGKAFIYFHSDTAQIMPGFYITYSIDSCPLECSNRGDCNYQTLTCRCNQGYFGDGCQHILCPNNCTSPIHGNCDQDKSCICNHDFTWPDCSQRADQQNWNLILNADYKTPARAFHQAAIIDQKMWIFGGKSQALSNTNTGIFKHKKTPMILSYDLASGKWNNYDELKDLNFLGETNQDHLADLSGHSIATLGSKVFIFGGFSMNNTVLNTLTVFDSKTKTLNVIESKKVNGLDEEFAAPLSVAGHSANIIDGQMYVFLGYNPLYGYLNFAQKFNIANNSWSIIPRRGSSTIGLIGHTSSFDPITRLVYIYGGHNAVRTSRLYSFNPQTETWKYLQSAPSPRHYHSAIIMNGLLTILGGNSYVMSHNNHQCFQQTHLVYDLSCANQTAGCGRKCWSIMNDDGLGILRRHGHSIVVNDNSQELLLYGGFNGLILNDLRSIKISSCSNYTSEADCEKLKIGLNCKWNSINSACEIKDKDSFGQSDVNSGRDLHECSRIELHKMNMVCEARETCTDCLSTSFGCVWCGLFARCQYNKCTYPSNREAIQRAESCYREETLHPDNKIASLDRIGNNTQLLKKLSNMPSTYEQDNEIDCKVDNCYLCNSKLYCSWQNDGCIYSYSPNSNSLQLHQGPSVIVNPDELDISNLSNTRQQPDRASSYSSTSKSNQFSPVLFNSSPTCDTPCFLRRSCNECTTTKCIWCSTTEQCIDSSAYFAYHPMGQCMHYVAHSAKCPVASCSDIETCDKCLTNPKCGWLNDISNTGKGRCIEGLSSGPILPSLADDSNLYSSINIALNTSSLSNWYYTSCPSCQCNGHSYCKPNSGSCVAPCQDFTEGPNCDRCISGYHGDPVNGGSCQPCRCNGHATTCNRETGKCYCSTKGIIGHNCSKCDDKNYYIGDPSSPSNGTCYYNLTTDYQYTFNMSKPEDHFYSDINFINVPLRKDLDADFSIACSRLALVNISSGTSYKNRRTIQAGLECGSFRFRFPHDRHAFTDANFSFFVHVYKFQTPFILQISFSQNRNMYLPQFFFTFSSCFLFFFALTGIVWKLKHEYDLYVRRQRQFIEMEQMASRPFSTILLEMFRPAQAAQKLKGDVDSPDGVQKGGPQHQQLSTLDAQTVEPTPISFEPCFGSNVGVLSLFVQLPGRPNLAIGSALVSLNDDQSTSSGEALEDASNEQAGKRRQTEKEQISLRCPI